MRVVTVFITMLIVSCTPSPKDIQFGHDMCAFCKMTVVDQRHAAQLVTAKGRVHMYDAVECMVHMIQDNPAQKYAYALVCDYANPGSLITAEEATFLISENIPSPMGANLSAFGARNSAVQALENAGGTLYNWDQLQAQFQ